MDFRAAAAGISNRPFSPSFTPPPTRLAIVRKRLKIRKSLNEILQIVRVNILEQLPLEELLATQPALSEQKVGDEPSQKFLLLNDE
jgi:hypothetical protein